MVDAHISKQKWEGEKSFLFPVYWFGLVNDYEKVRNKKWGVFIQK